ncbi:Capsular polysaccharide export system periplasmic protein KpsD [Vibrio chagasii]|nr:Capsular polysaccharide export system periplasmic protein KpsD [Vibrio chagasii]
MKSFLKKALLFSATLFVAHGVWADQIKLEQQDVVSPQREIASDRFGASLFVGNFNKRAFSAIHDDYLLNVGDQIDVNIWGTYNWENTVTIDKQGFVFIPHVGAVKLSGVLAKDLNGHLNNAIKGTYTDNVEIYSNLSVATPVQVFVSGYVNKPGLYNGAAGDSILSFIDSAKGIDDDRGSYLNVSLRRGGEVIEDFNLYDFLLKGNIPFRQLRSGDVIFVDSRQSLVSVTSGAESVSIEIEGDVSLGGIIPLFPPQNTDSHVRIESYNGNEYSVQYHDLANAKDIGLSSGDAVTFVSDLQIKNIGVRVQGEHDSARERVLEPNTTLGSLISEIELNDFSAIENIQIFRVSEQEKQADLFNQSLDALEKSVLTARSGTIEGAKLRTEEAALILSWVEKARTIEPKGQVVLSESSWKDLVLETGDIVDIPRKTNIVSVSGEVLFPRAITISDGDLVMDYIENAGGLTQDANTSRVMIMKPSGNFESIDIGSRKGRAYVPEKGDVVMILPDIKAKNMQFTKDITEILYQIAISTSVVLGI